MGYVSQRGFGTDRANTQEIFRRANAAAGFSYDILRGLDVAAQRGDEYFPVAACDTVATWSMEKRLLLYLVLRTERRHHVAFSRNSEEWSDAFRVEARRLIRTLEGLERLKASPQAFEQGPDAIALAYSCGVGCTDASFDAFTGKAVPHVVSTANVLDYHVLIKGSCDLIITDPPYGFNTTADIRLLAALYREAVPKMVEALRPGGQLVVALPDWSHSGRTVPAFVRKEFVTHQVLVAANAAGKELDLPTVSSPTPGWMFRPPFYWNSEKALRRAILHFRFKS